MKWNGRKLEIERETLIRNSSAAPKTKLRTTKNIKFCFPVHILQKQKHPKYNRSGLLRWVELSWVEPCRSISSRRFTLWLHIYIYKCTSIVIIETANEHIQRETHAHTIIVRICTTVSVVFVYSFCLKLRTRMNTTPTVLNVWIVRLCYVYAAAVNYTWFGSILSSSSTTIYHIYQSCVRLY